MGQNRRGVLTPEVERIAQGTVIPFPELTVRELRLMPYIKMLAMDGLRLDPSRINKEERTIFSNWRHRGFVFGGASEPVAVSVDFWDTINDILWEAYANPNS